MFGLSIVDHVRLNLTRTGENYTVHARAAERLAGRITRIRMGLFALILSAAVVSVLSLTTGWRPYQIATAVSAGLACASYAAYLASGLEGRVHAHRVCAHHLWLVCERHRALLTEIQDGLLDRDAILRRRDELAQETHGAYGLDFPLDQPAYEGLRQSVDREEFRGFHDPHADPLAASS